MLDEIIAKVWGDELILEEWQREPLQKILEFLLSTEKKQQLHICMVGAHGTGKTTLLAWSILLSILLLSTTDRPFKGSLYSGKFDQLKTTLLRETLVWAQRSNFVDSFDLHAHKFAVKDCPYAIDAKSWSVTEIQRSAGQHEETSIIFIDEATAVPREVITKLQGSTTDPRVLWVMCSNPDKNVGYVYDLFNYDKLHWDLYQIGQQDLGNRRSFEYEDRMRAEYGEDSDEYRVMVLGKFPLHSSQQFFDQYFLDACRDRKILASTCRKLKMGIDIATGEGADYSTIIVRQGNEILFIDRKKVIIPEMRAWIEAVCRKYRISEFAIDEVGVGCGLAQELSKQYLVHRVNGAAKANNVVRFYNRRAELYDAAREWVIYCGVIGKGKEQDELIRQMSLVTHKYKGTQRQMVPKSAQDDWYDYVDALVYTFAVPDSQPSRGIVYNPTVVCF